MDEPVWATSTNAVWMLEFVRRKASERKLRLLGVACLRDAWSRLPDERSRRAVDFAERYAYGEVDATTLQAVVDDAWEVRNELWDEYEVKGPDRDRDDRLFWAEAAGWTACVDGWRRMKSLDVPSNMEIIPFRIRYPNIVF